MTTGRREWPKTLTGHAVGSSAVVGEILCLGMFGGAISSHYRVAEITKHYTWPSGETTPCEATLVRVLDRSIRNEDGTFSSVWVDA